MQGEKKGSDSGDRGAVDAEQRNQQSSSGLNPELKVTEQPISETQFKPGMHYPVLISTVEDMDSPPSLKKDIAASVSGAANIALSTGVEVWPSKASWCCNTCNVPLCLTTDRNCFESYHSQESVQKRFFWLKNARANMLRDTFAPCTQILFWRNNYGVAHDTAKKHRQKRHHKIAK